MNKQLQKFARNELKKGVAKLPERWQELFKRMYGPKNSKLSIDATIDNMPEDKLDWAMTQVEKSIEKLKTLHDSQHEVRKEET